MCGRYYRKGDKQKIAEAFHSIALGLRNPRAALLFAAIMFATVVFRFAALGRVPPGISCDEALNGIEGIAAQQTHHYRIFYSNNNGREGLWINLIGVSESMFGVNEVGLRFPAAMTDR
jgi:hypothetical protein